MCMMCLVFYVNYMISKAVKIEFFPFYTEKRNRKLNLEAITSNTLNT